MCEELIMIANRSVCCNWLSIIKLQPIPNSTCWCFPGETAERHRASEQPPDRWREESEQPRAALPLPVLARETGRLPAPDTRLPNTARAPRSVSTLNTRAPRSVSTVKTRAPRSVSTLKTRAPRSVSTLNTRAPRSVSTVKTRSPRSVSTVKICPHEHLSLQWVAVDITYHFWNYYMFGISVIITFSAMFRLHIKKTKY